MELLNKVINELNKQGYEFRTTSTIDLLRDAVYTTAKILSGQEQAKEPEPKKTPTTYRECLEALPDGYRELALENAEAQNWWAGIPNDPCQKIYDAIEHCFYWISTPEKIQFWCAVYDHYEKGTPLPELPTN